MKSVEWKTYRTRFLVQAKQLSSTLSFTDHLGRQHCGRKGDYLVESSDGVITIAPRRIFEDVYVPISQGNHPNIDQTKLDAKKTNQMKVTPNNFSPPNLEQLRFEPLDIERVPVHKSAIDRQRAEGRSPILHDEIVRVRRKYPQPIRDRTTAPNLRLM
jgi:hypothetical protein